MTPRNALSILDQTAARAAVPRNEHALAQQAVQILAAVLNAVETPPDPDTEPADTAKAKANGKGSSAKGA